VNNNLNAAATGKQARNLLVGTIYATCILSFLPAALLAEKTPAERKAPERPCAAKIKDRPAKLPPPPAEALKRTEKYWLDLIEKDRKSKDVANQIIHLCQLSMYYAVTQEKSRGEAVLKEADALAEKLPAGKSPARAEAVLSLAACHFNSGNYEKARRQYDSVIKSGLSSLTPEQQLRAYVEKQGLLSATGNYSQAAALNSSISPLLKKTAAGKIVAKASILAQAGKLEYYLGHYAAAEKTLKEARSLLTSDRQPHLLELSLIQCDLGAVYTDLDRDDLAEKCLNESLSTARSAVGQTSALSGSPLRNLAKLETKKGNLDGAEKLLEEALKSSSNEAGAAGLEYARTLANLAEVKRLNNELADSEKYLNESLAIYKKQLGANIHPDAATAENNLGMVQFEKGRLDEAQKLLKQALSDKEETLGKSHPDCAVVLNNLAYLAEKQQQFAEAEKLYLQSQQITQAAFGKESAALATILNNRALAAESQLKNAESEKLHLQALAIRRKYASSRPTDFVNSLNNLGELYLAGGNFQKAAQLLDEAGRAADSPKFPDRRLRATLLGNRALLADRRQDYPVAEKFYRQALSACADSYGKVSLEYARALSNLAGLLRLEHKFKEAAPLQSESLSIRQKLSGAESLDAAREYNNTGELYLALGNLSEAQSLLDRALKIRQPKLGESQRDTSVTLCALGKLRLAQKKIPEAQQLLERCRKIQEKILKNNDEKLANTYFALSELFLAQGQKERGEKMKQAALTIMKRARTGSP
jgi:tetratricopeptide (TPR) repeat protein